MRVLVSALMIAMLVVPWCCSLPGNAGGLHEDLYAGWDSALHKYVNGKGEVNYRDWKTDRQSLDSFLQAASEVTAGDCAQMSKNEKLALWINLYNAFTAKQVLDHYPIQRSGFNLYPTSSIRQIDGVWDKYRVACCGRNVTLSEIENKILRGEFGEPLIHFAINCASHSCPKLMNRAYKGPTLEKDLNEASRAFVTDPTRNRIDVRSRKVELSKIFDWFGDDFKARYSAPALSGRSAKESAVINFVLANVQGSDKELISSNKFSLGYLPYDWSLNEQGAGH